MPSLSGAGHVRAASHDTTAPAPELAVPERRPFARSPPGGSSGGAGAGGSTGPSLTGDSIVCAPAWLPVANTGADVAHMVACGHTHTLLVTRPKRRDTPGKQAADADRGAARLPGEARLRGTQAAAIAFPANAPSRSSSAPGRGAAPAASPSRAIAAMGSPARAGMAGMGTLLEPAPAAFPASATSASMVCALSKALKVRREPLVALRLRRTAQSCCSY